MQTTVIFKADKKRKEEAQKLAKQMGIPFSAVMNRLMDEFVMGKKITFVGKPLKLTPYAEKMLAESEKDFREGNVERFNSIEDAFKDLL